MVAQALKRSETRLVSAIRAAAMSAWEWDLRAKRLSWACALEEIHGLSPTHPSNGLKMFLKTVHPNDRGRVRNALRNGFLDSNSLQITYRIVNSSSQVRWIRTTMQLAASETTSAEHLLGTSVDITAQVHFEEELRQAKTQADQANQTKSEFLANISHEIRTPMTAILGFAEMMQADEVSESDRRTYLKAVRRNGKHLLRIIDDILDLSKVESGHMAIDESDFDLNDFFSDISFPLERRAQAKGIRLKISASGKIPKTIRSDRARLRQIILNVVGNALKFTKRGAVSLNISLAKRHGAQEADYGDLLSFIVSDTGCGIPHEQHPHIFQPFMQADSSIRRTFGGTGLGLALSRKLAQALGGDIFLESSEVGKGSRFCITIDPGRLAFTEMQIGLRKDHALVTEPPQRPLEEAPLRGFNVLLAEDGIDIQALFAQMLRQAGATVDVANNGFEALQKALHHKYDILLLDVQMPELDGLKAAAKMRNCGLNTPMVALTAHAMIGDREKCIDAGFNDYLSKPFDRHDLVKITLKWVGGSDHGNTSTSLMEASGGLDVAPVMERQRTAAKPIYSRLADDPIVSPLLPSFAQLLQQRVAALVNASSNNDSVELARLAHLIKGSAASYGFDEAAKGAAAIELAAKARDERLPDMIQDLNVIAARIGQGIAPELTCT